MIESLVFKISGITFGIDTNSISKMITLEKARHEKILSCWFHEKILFSGKKVSYKRPRILLAKSGQLHSGIIIDQPENIIQLTDSDIRPLPEFIKMFSGTAPIRDIVLKDEELILLVDLYRLLACESHME